MVRGLDFGRYFGISAFPMFPLAHFFRREQSDRMKTFSTSRSGTWALLFFAATTLGLFAGTTDPVTPRRPTELFNGRDLTGWTAVAKGTNTTDIWWATNGVIRCAGKPFGYLRTLQTYRDYQLHVEWRWPAGPGNSGVFLQLNPPDKVWPYCYEAQLLAGSAGEIRLNGGATLQAINPPTAKSVPRRLPSSEKPAGEWNSYDLVCRGHSITVRVNGVLQNEVTGTSVDSGCIGLQAEGQIVEFRNLTLAPLPVP